MFCVSCKIIWFRTIWTNMHWIVVDGSRFKLVFNWKYLYWCGNVKQRETRMNFKFLQNLSPSRTPSQVWIFSELLTGIVPSPDSILVRSCPRALRFGWLSTRSSLLAASWGEKILASPQGAVLINKWNLTWDFTLNPFPSGFSSKMESLALPVKQNQCKTRKLFRCYKKNDLVSGEAPNVCTKNHKGSAWPQFQRECRWGCCQDRSCARRLCTWCQ